MTTEATDFAANPADPSPLSQSLHPQNSQRHGRFEEDFDARTRGSSIIGDHEVPQRSASRASTLNQGSAPQRSGTLKKRSSVKRSGSLKRSGSRRSTHAGSIRGVSFDDEDHASKYNSVFFTPVPTAGAPTDVLANRFQAWRKFLKDLITYFREVSSSYEHRAKSLLKVSNVINNTNAPSMFMVEGGLNDANRLLRDFHKQSIVEANKARDIETEVINQLSGLRADLGQKIKEIKSLSGDFKNTVEKEKETTRKCVAALTEALALVDSDPAAVAGKGDPYVVRLGVDRQVEKQIDEENYLHRAYLNLENSGRELESIVVGEIQKAYNALATILKRDADEIYSTVEQLRNGPIGMPRDVEWNHFVHSDPHFVDPNLPMRHLEQIEYPGKHHPATTEVRAGMLERKSKYLKSYTPGWYVLSPTHLHEFKSADRIYTQPPVMSLYLPDQKLGSHSQPGSSSHKFVLKGRQTGSMHRGHTWVFRAETYDTMLAWYEDVKTLTEKTGEERNAFVRRHARSLSQGSARSVSTNGELEEDEADQVPYTGTPMTRGGEEEDSPKRPSPGGRFPSDIQIDRNLQAPPSPYSDSSEVDHDLTTASGGLQSGYPYAGQTANYETMQSRQQNYDVTPTQSHQQTPAAPVFENVPAYQDNADQSYPPQGHYEEYNQTQTRAAPFADPSSIPVQQPASNQAYGQPRENYDSDDIQPVERHNSTYGDWMAPAAGGAAGGLAATAAYHQHQKHQEQAQEREAQQQYQHQEQIQNREAQQQQYQHQEQVQEREAQQQASMEANQTSTGNTSAQAMPSPVPMSGVAIPIHSEGPSLSEAQSFLARDEAVAAAVSSTQGGTLVQEDTGVTGRVFPGMNRQNTNMTISDLHIPGEYPRVHRMETE